MSDFEVSDIGRLKKLQVRIGRLEKKITKLKKQRDFHEERHVHYAKVLELQPYLHRRYESYNDRIARENLNKQNAKTVIEQSKLIEMLMKENEQLRTNSIDATKM